MGSVNLTQILTLYIWIMIAVLTGIVFLIARFYQKSSGEPTRYQLFLAPLAFFLGGTLRYASGGQVGGDALGGVLWFVGAVLQIVLCVALYRQMTRGRQ